MPRRHVCTNKRNVTYPVRTKRVICKPVYKKYMVPCGKQWCEGIRLVYEQYHKEVVANANHTTVDYTCCPGWTQISWRSHGCSKPVCNKPCMNGGKCVKPNTCSCPPGFVGTYCETKTSLYAPDDCNCLPKDCVIRPPEICPNCLQFLTPNCPNCCLCPTARSTNTPLSIHTTTCHIGCSSKSLREGAEPGSKTFRTRSLSPQRSTRSTRQRSLSRSSYQYRTTSPELEASPPTCPPPSPREHSPFSFLRNRHNGLQDDIPTDCSPSCLNGGTCNQATSKCVCKPGYTGRRCERDIDECKENKPCDQFCYNTPGSFNCECRESFTLQPDGQTCRREYVDGTTFEARDLEQQRFDKVDKRLQKLEKIIREQNKNEVTKQDLQKIYSNIDRISGDISTISEKLERLENASMTEQKEKTTGDMGVNLTDSEENIKKYKELPRRRRFWRRSSKPCASPNCSS